MRGAIREDDGGRLVGQVFADEAQPLDDPYGNFNRFCNHFFDPLNNQRLTDPRAAGVCVTQDTFATAPVWASGAVDPFATASVQEDTARRNHFTLYDAREAMWRALTGRDKSFNFVTLTPLDRKAYWATTFRALGDVLHLIQDMAQPQHTRNEAHGLGHATHYEKYIDARAKGERRIRLGGLLGVGALTVDVTPFTSLDYGGYAAPRFAHYSKYWSTGTGPASLAGRGLADYSSRGFFTPGANYGDGKYPSPPSDPTAYTRQVISASIGIKEEYWIAPVYDAYAKAHSKPVRMTRSSQWDDALAATGAGQASSFSLDTGTFDDRASLLVPRAVAYSAGLLDYFFNPRLRIDPPAEGVYGLVDAAGGGGFPVIRLKLTNATPPLVDDGVEHPQHMLDGLVVAVAKFHRNLCYRADLSGEYGAPGNGPNKCRGGNSATPGQLDIDDSAEEIVVSKPINLSLNAGQSMPLAFDFSASPVPLGASDVYLQVVYRGALGRDVTTAERDVVAVGTRDISEPSYFTYFNASDYVHIGSRVYTRAQVAQSQALLEQVQPRTCLAGTVGSRKLNAGCFTPFTLSLQLSFGNLSDPSIRVVDLPSRRFFRVAVLTDSERSAVKERSMSKAALGGEIVPKPRLAAALLPGDHTRMRTSEKALLYQQTTCLPLDPFDVMPVDNQLRFDNDLLEYHIEATTAVRGVAGYVQASCVQNGDASTPGAPDDRNAVMSVLNTAAGERLAFPVSIHAGFLRP
ncbi:MAG: hypothetical protein ABI920_18510 [Casimicrobiaceae bacterium]